MNRIEIVVDRNICCSSGMCALASPQVFDQDEEAVVVLLDPEPPEDLHEEVRAAEKRCPSGAILIRPWD